MSKGTAVQVDRAAAYGDGLFETIALRNSKPRFWDSHLARLQTGCERLGLACPSAAELRKAIAMAVRETDVATDFATLRLVVWAAPGPRGYKRAPGGTTQIRVTIFAAQPLPVENYANGITTRMCTTRLAIQPQLAGLKSLNRLEQVLARAEWDDEKTFEGLTCDTDDRLICGTMSNVFMVTEDRLVTPAITRCGVSGIMRRHVISLLQNAKIDFEVRDIAVSEIESATEMFLTNSQFGILPVRLCGTRRWPAGPVTRRVQELAAAHDVPECAS